MPTMQRGRLISHDQRPVGTTTAVVYDVSASELACVGYILTAAAAVGAFGFVIVHPFVAWTLLAGRSEVWHNHKRSKQKLHERQCCERSELWCVCGDWCCSAALAAWMQDGDCDWVAASWTFLYIAQTSVLSVHSRQ